MKPFSPPPHRHNTLRYSIADYSDPGVYFITTCTRDRIPLFGKIENDQMQCNDFGRIVWEIWKMLPQRCPQISIDAAIVMPDHFHGLIVIHEKSNRNSTFAPSGQCCEDLNFPQGNLLRRRMTIPFVVGYFKMNTAKRINFMRGTPGVAVWQRNYYDKILRDDRDYDSLVEYIVTNPMRWGMDKD